MSWKAIIISVSSNSLKHIDIFVKIKIEIGLQI